MDYKTLGTIAFGWFLLRNFVSRETISFPKFKPQPNTTSLQNLSICWLGHATFLINLYGRTILIDPVFSNRAGFTLPGDFNLGTKRYVLSPLTVEEIGPVDLILMSHGHVDHFDYPTLRKLQSPFTNVITSAHTGFLWNGLMYRNINELFWGETIHLNGLTVRAIKGAHKAARLPWNTQMTANGYLISCNGTNIFYAGDTAYTPIIREQLHGIPIDVAIFGIANYRPRSYEKKHCTPEQAWQMAEEIGARRVIPMHWGTFKLSEEPMLEPISRFYYAAGPGVNRVPISEIGQAWIL